MTAVIKILLGLLITVPIAFATILLITWWLEHRGWSIDDSLVDVQRKNNRRNLPEKRTAGNTKLQELLLLFVIQIIFTLVVYWLTR